MHSSIPVPLTSISPPSRDGCRLAATVVAPALLGLADRHEMYGLLRANFDGTTRARFEADLREKEAAILLRDGGSGAIKGFTTYTRMEIALDGRATVAFFSGDTIVDRDFWGETALARAWARAVFADAERIAMARPGTAVYWFLICSGYRTWRFLPVFFREFYPNPSTAALSPLRRIVDALATERFADEYAAERGIVRFREPTPVRPGLSDITAERARDPRIAFFARLNPGHASGDELACLAELSRANLTRAGLRVVLSSGDHA